MARKLASVQKIIDIKPVENSDKLDVATVLGWKVVVNRGAFSVGELICYCEPDSILPEKPEFEFLRARKFRIKTIKLRGQISQGIVFPLSVLNEQVFPVEGLDVTEIMGVEKHEIPIPACLHGKIRGPFPYFIPKTDEIRLQSVPGFLDRHRDKPFYATEKLDGSSMTIYQKDGEFGVCSRNLELLEDEKNAYWTCVRKHGLREKLAVACEQLGSLAVQGELVGPGVQGNKYKLDELRFYVFNIYSQALGDYMDGEWAFELCKSLGFDFVPVLYDMFAFPVSVDMAVSMAVGSSRLNPEAKREGVVLRCAKEGGRDEETGRISVKVLNPEFLLENE